jgi:hypothetical protein
MKNNQLTFILLGVFFLTTLGTAVLSYKFTSSFRRLQAVQVKINMLKNTELFLNQLIKESDDYSKKDPSITPILQGIATTSPNPAAMLPPSSPAK